MTDAPLSPGGPRVRHADAAGRALGFQYLERSSHPARCAVLPAWPHAAASTYGAIGIAMPHAAMPAFGAV